MRNELGMLILCLASMLAGCNAPPSGYKHAMLRIHESRFSEAARELFPLASSGHAPSQFQLGVILLQDPALRAEGITWLQRAAQSGNLGARYQIAVAHRDGTVLSQSLPAALDEFRGLAERGFAPARFELARLLESQGAASFEEARRWYGEAARDGHEGAVRRMVALYEHGELGVAIDSAQASSWRERLTAKSF